MGSVELLSREGEIAIAKRIEAGRNTYIGGLCESPLTFQAITIWREELLDEKIMLRDVIDLDATFGSMSESELPEEVKIEGFENQKPTSEIRDDNLKESLAEEFNNIKVHTQNVTSLNFRNPFFLIYSIIQFYTLVLLILHLKKNLF